MKKLVLLALPCVFMLAGCGGNGGNGGDGGQAYNSSTTRGGYAASGETPVYSSSSPAYSNSYTKYDNSSSYTTSARNGAPFGNYPINYNARAKTNCPDGSCGDGSK